MNTTQQDKLKDVPDYVLDKFLREVEKARKKMMKNIIYKCAGKTPEEAEYLSTLEKDILVARYKQLITLHLKKYGIKKYEICEICGGKTTDYIRLDNVTLACNDCFIKIQIKKDYENLSRWENKGYAE